MNTSLFKSTFIGHILSLTGIKLFILQDVLGAVNKHKDGPLTMAEYSATNTILQHKALFVRMNDNNGGSL